MQCRKCSKVLVNDEQFCTECGFYLDKKEDISISKEMIKPKFDNKLLNFLSINWFKVCILILITGGILFWIVYSQKNIAEKIAYERQNDCRELVNKERNMIEKKDNFVFLYSWNYKYNKNTKRCILTYEVKHGHSYDIFTGFINEEFDTTFLIVDLFSDDELYKVKNVSDDETMLMSSVKKKWEEKRDYYFNEK